MLEMILLPIFVVLAAVQLVAFSIFFVPDRKSGKKFVPPLSVIIPAHNESTDIADTIKSVLSSDYENDLEVIVVDDGSTDGTSSVVKKEFGGRVRLHTIPHSGKSEALNYGTRKASHGIVAFVDADSALDRDSLEKLVAPLNDRDVVASTGVIRAKCTKNPLTWFQDIDYIISSGWRYISSKINAVYAAPGFAAFRKSELRRAGGFSRDTLTEDLDIGLDLRKSGHKVAMSPATVYTTVPSTLKSLFRQRMRWGRGSIQVAQKHSDVLFSRKFGFVGFYSFPMHLFWYAFAILYVPFLFYWFFGDYVQYFLFGSGALSVEAGMFFVKWLTLYGIFDLIYVSLSAASPLAVAVISAWIFSFLYFLALVVKFGFRLRLVVAYLFIFPYFWFIMTVQGISLIYEFASRGKTENIWEKRGDTQLTW